MFHAGFAFNENGVKYYSVYYKDRSSEVLSTLEMMKRYPELLVRILEKMV